MELLKQKVLDYLKEKGVNRLTKEEAYVLKNLIEEKAENNIKMMNELDEIRKEWLYNGIIFFCGIILGLFGGIIADILSKYFSKYDPYYSIIVILIFIFFVWFVFQFIKETYNPMDNKKYREIHDHMVAIAKKRKKNKEINK